MCGPQSLITVCPFPEKNRQFQFQGIFEIFRMSIWGWRSHMTWLTFYFTLRGAVNISCRWQEQKRSLPSGQEVVMVRCRGAALEQPDKDWIRDVTWRWSQQGSLTDWYEVEKTVKGKSYNCKLNYHVVVYLRREMHTMYFLIVFGSQMIFFFLSRTQKKKRQFLWKMNAANINSYRSDHLS